MTRFCARLSLPGLLVACLLVLLAGCTAAPPRPAKGSLVDLVPKDGSFKPAIKSSNSSALMTPEELALIEEMVNPADPAAAQRLNAENTPTGRYTRPDEIAGLVMYLCSDIAANITGAHFVIDGGRGAASGAFKK